MRVVPILVLILGNAWPQVAAAQGQPPARDTVAIGGDVGFLAPDTGEAQVLKTATGTADAFIEYYYTDRVSLRVMYGWAAPPYESIAGRSLQRHHLNLNVIYNWKFGSFRPFATIGGGAYFLSRREDDEPVGSRVTKPGGNLGWGGEYHLRTFVVKSEMLVHILTEEKSFPDQEGNTLAAFTWTFGIKVPF
jgi:hypothetical protein